MSVKSDALYLNLLEDLDWALTAEDYTLLLKGEALVISADLSPAKAAAKALINSFYKKFIDDISFSADAAALQKFVSANNCCADFQGLRFDNCSSWEEELLGEFRRRVHLFFEPLSCISFGSILDRGRLGPGSNIGSGFSDSYSKLFSSKLTCTNTVLHQVYKAWTKESDRYASAEDFRASIFGECSFVEGNRLSFVPKTRLISRTICTEPTLNMFFQLGLGALIEDRLKEVYNIDLSFQSMLNKMMAGSTSSGSPKYATIDLESASDTISLRLIDEVMPASFAAWLHLFRSPKVRLPSGDYLTLSMVSSMGNGFTFPLQTAIFSCLVDSVYRCRNRRLVRNHSYRSGRDVKLTHGNFGVFGDDIIILNDLFKDTCWLLTRCGFRVNSLKSFNEGVFRESCGSDFFKGSDIRGVYCTTLKSPQARYSLLNRILRWQSKQSILLPRVTSQLLNGIRRLLVPAWEADDSGIKTPRFVVQPHLRDRDTQSVKYRRWIPLRSSVRFLEDRVIGPRIEKARHFNPDGVFLTLLQQRGGTGGIVGVRPAQLSYRLDTSICPNWDQLTALSEQEQSEFRAWAAIVASYLCPTAF